MGNKGDLRASLFFLFLFCQAWLVYSQNQTCYTDDLNALRGFLKGLKSDIPGWSVNESSPACCSWSGVLCGLPAINGSRVIGLELSNRGLEGNVVESLAGLDQLENLDLSSNRLRGPVPALLFQLPLLEFLNMSNNMFFGTIPANLSLPAIKVFNISYNSFAGRHPVLAGSSNLTALDISSNGFSGQIDAGVCNFSAGIRSLVFSMNNFSGELPGGLSSCSSLTEISVASNSIGGSLPDDLFLLKSLTRLFLEQNSFSGNLSSNISNLTNLIQIDISLNHFSGFIPDAFSDLTKLAYFAARSNDFSGIIPSSLSSSPSLKSLDLNDNNLSGKFSINCTAMVELTSIDVGSNLFSGSIPDYLPQCLLLSTLNLAKNDLTGEIPQSFSNFSTISDLSLSLNRFVNVSSAMQILQHCPNLTSLVFTRSFPRGESLPAEIQGFKKLQLLVIPNCGLQGPIPSWLGNLQQLMVLDISWNSFTGTIPPWLGNMDNLFYLDLSNNSLTGDLPINLTQMKSLISASNLQQGGKENVPIFIKRNSTGNGLPYNHMSSFPTSLILNHNKLVGGILPGFGQLANLQVLDLSWNNLTGTIPEELSGMSSLESLILSHNELDGEIPSSLTKLNFLSAFDVSYNNLVGAVPKGGQFSTFQTSDFQGNSGLCGIHLSSCSSLAPPKPSGNRHSRGTIIAMAVGIGMGTAFLLALFYLVVIRNRSKRHEEKAKVVAHADENSYSLVLLFQKEDRKELSIDDILKATNNFNQAQIIGAGGFGLVYKATLPGGRNVAIKRLSGDFFQMEREFQAEIETLSRAQHRNLVLLQGYCKIGSDRILIYRFMENGSLDYWLHEKANGGSILTWDKRLNIAIGAARGLAYLHHSCDPNILHRDIKSSNILLDENFEAHLADFGLARLILPTNTHVTTDLVGTLGYIPPEYGLSSVATFKGDVYSFGAVLLELLTGRRPVDMCKPKTSREMISWVVEMRRERREVEVFDLSIRDTGHDDQLKKVLDIACLCVSDSPKSRPLSHQLVAWLEEIGELSEEKHFGKEKSKD